MKPLVAALKSALTLVLSWTLIFAAPISASAQEEYELPQSEVPEEGPGLADEVAKIAESAERLIDRKLFPGVVGNAAEGAPTETQIGLARAQALKVKDLVQAELEAHIASISKTALEGSVLGDIITPLYLAIQTIETVAVMSGEPADPAVWVRDYTIRLPMPDKLVFLQFAGQAAHAFVDLPGAYSPEVLDAIQSGAFAYSTRLEPAANGEKSLSFQLNPDFLYGAEDLQQFISRTKKAALIFATRHAIRQSYSAMATTRDMLGFKPETLPAPSDAVLTAVPSAKIYRDSVLLQFERRELAREKRIVWLALLRALDEVRKTEPTLFTALYWSQIHHMSGFDASVVDAPSLLRAEQNNFPIALAALLNLHPKSDWSKAAPALVADTAKLLLDWMILGNAELALRLDPRAADSLRTMHAGIAQSLGAKVAARLQQSQALAPGAFARAKHAERARGLDEFNKNMIEIAKQIKDYASDDLQLKYLIQAKQGAIDGLKLQSTASGLVELLKAAPTYRQGYMLHRALLLDMLESYKLKGESASGAAQPFSALPNDTRFNFSFFERVKDRVEFNPEIHRDTMNAKFLERLTKNAGRRVKDIQDLIALGKVLKFDRYENRPVDVTKGAPNHRQLAQPTVGNLIPGTQGLWAWFSQDERAEYLQQMKNDLFNKAPLLGARRLNPDWTLGSKGLKAWEIRSKYHPHFVWEYLAAEHLTPAQIDQLMRLQLTQVADQTRANLNELSGEIHKLGRMAEESLDGVSQTLRTLISLSSQISMNLEAAPAFAVHSQNIKRELLMPGFWRSEWESFMHFTDSAMIYLLVFVVVQSLGSRIRATAPVFEWLNKTLAPTLGLNMSRLSAVLWAVILPPLADYAYSGFVFEPAQARKLEQYVACAASPDQCVATRSDVTNQDMLAEAYRTKFYASVGSLALFMGVFGAVRWAASRRATGVLVKDANAVRNDMRTLGMEGVEEINDSAIRAALNSQIQSLRSQSNPLARALGETHLEQAALRLEAKLNQKVTELVRAESRLQDLIKRLDLPPRVWKELDNAGAAENRMGAIYKAEDILEHARATKQISSAEYMELTAEVQRLYGIVNPIWSAMFRAPDTLGPFYRGVWSRSAKRISMVRLQTENAELQKRISREFEKAIDDAMTPRRSFLRGGKPVERPLPHEMLERLARQIEASPKQAARWEQLLKQVEKQVHP